jgi:signal transduction histidine kinase
MTTIEQPAELGLSGITHLAGAASRALEGDVVITSQISSGESTVAAAAGISEHDANLLLPALRSIERGFGLDEAAGRIEGRDILPLALEAHGYANVLSAAVRLGSHRVGAIFLLRETPATCDEGLMCAFARHAAVAIAGAKTPGHALAPPPETVDALVELSSRPLVFPDLVSALNGALEPLFGPISSGIMLWEHDRDVLQMVPGSFGADEGTAASYQVSATNSYSNSARVFSTGDPYLTNEAVRDPAVIQEWVQAFGIRRLISVRLMSRDEPVGVLHLLNKDTDFTLLDLWRLQPLLPRISGAVEIARTLLLLRREKQLADVLTGAAVAIAAGKGVQEVLTPALDGFCDAIGASVIALVPATLPPILWRSGTADPLQERQLVLQARQDPKLHAEITGPMRVGDPGSAVFHVPVVIGAQRLGTLSTLRLRAEPFAPDERNALERLGNLAALAWAAERYQQQRAELARLDERQRIADDLHDDVAQILFAAQMALDATLELDDLDERVTTNVLRARALLLKSDVAIRVVIRQLSRRPATDLATHLAEIVLDVEREFGLPVHLEISETGIACASQMRKTVRDVVIKVARESLVNAAKHAGPCRAVVSLRQGSNERLVLSVTDDGLGVREPRTAGTHHGLGSLRRTVRSHGGHLRVTSSPTGTTVRLSFPS